MNNRGISFLLMVVFGVFVLSSYASAAEKCFFSSQKLTEDAQNIRLCAMDMGWKVGKVSSLIAAAVIEGKVKLYPKDAVEVCLRDIGRLQIREQSLSRDAGKAKWHSIPAKSRKETFVHMKAINNYRSAYVPL